MRRMAILLAMLLVTHAATSLAQESTTPYNCDYSPSCEVAPGVYGAMASPAQSKFNLSVGGYVKFDYAHNTNAVGPRSPASGIPLGGSFDESIFTAKQTRFWLKVSGPTFLGAKTSALIEADFYGSGAGSNETGNLRMRHAYGTLDWPTTQVLFGQYWDIFGPAAADTIDAWQGASTGAPNGPREVQLRVTQRVKLGAENGLKVVLGVQNPVQDKGDANNTPAGSGTNASASATPGGYGSMPALAGQLMFTSRLLGVSPGYMGLGMSPFQIGFFGQTYGVKIATSKTHLNVFGYGAYAFVPLLRSSDGKHRTGTLSLEAQAYKARGLSVELANATALANTISGHEAPAKGFGYYGQLKFYPTQELGFTGGYGGRHAEDYASFIGAGNKPTQFEKFNTLAYVNATYDINAAIRLATEFEHAETKAGNVAAGKPGYGQNNTFRFAAYYFF